MKLSRYNKETGEITTVDTEKSSLFEWILYLLEDLFNWLGSDKGKK